MGFFGNKYKDPVEKLIQEVVNDFKTERLLRKSDLRSALVCMRKRYTNEEFRLKIGERLEKRCMDREKIGLWKICTDFACVEFATSGVSEFTIMQATAHDLQKIGIRRKIREGRVYSLSYFKTAMEFAEEYVH